MTRWIAAGAALAPLLLVAGCAGGGGDAAAMEPAEAVTYAFDRVPAGAADGGLLAVSTGGATEARWRVVADPEAPSAPHVLEQQDDAFDDERFGLALAPAPIARDVRVSVRCRPVSGELDRSAGLVFRARDERNCYVVRANLLENDVNLYRVVDGVRTLVDGWKRRLARNAWHTLEVEARGERIVVRFDGEAVLDVRDTTHAAAGRAGLWTKADSVTRFDDLRIEPLD